MSIKKLLAASAILALSSAMAFTPPKTVTATVGFAPGSGNEVSFRIVAAQVAKTNPELNFVVQNRPGGGESVGVNWFAQQPTNGANLYIASQQGLFTATEIWFPGTLKINPMDMEFVTTIAKSPLAVVAHVSSPTNTPAQLLARMQNTRDPVNFALGAAAHQLVFEYLMDHVRGDRRLIQAALYKGPAQAVADVAGNQVEFGILPTAIAYPLVKAGKVKYIALAGEQRLSQIPDVPLWKDTVPGLTVNAAWMIMLPPGSPREQIDYYNRIFVAAINTPEARKMFEENLMFTVKSEQTPEGARAYMSQLIRKWESYVKRIKPN
jgi:tripartite-type tricarboxylate transporter receptor subunit TctC